MSDEYDPGYDRYVEPHERRGLGNTVIPEPLATDDIEPAYDT